MKSPRFLAALAMAALLTTGATAHAAVTDFTQNGGNNPSGQTPTQSADKFVPLTGGSLPFNAEGDIRVDGTFTKIINNFPTPKDEGHYLRITMPIKMDFTYDVDKNQLTSTDAVIVNNSVHATNSGSSTLNLEPKRVKMTIVNFEDNTLGTNTMNSGVEFVNTVNTTTANTPGRKVQLPFQLNIDGGTGNVTNYSIKNIQDHANKVTTSSANPITPIEIGPNSSLTVKLEKIAGQNVLGNTDLITNQTSLTSHNLKLKFEYDGK